jgi:hypothetical protein
LSATAGRNTGFLEPGKGWCTRAPAIEEESVYQEWIFVILELEQWVIRSNNDIRPPVSVQDGFRQDFIQIELFPSSETVPRHTKTGLTLNVHKKLSRKDPLSLDGTHSKKGSGEVIRGEN